MDKKVTGVGITALIFGIIGLIVYPVTLGILALIFGMISAKEDTLGIAGIVLGIIDIIWGIAIIVMYIY